MEENTIYLDYASTTPIDQEVLDAMLPYFTRNFGNPSSSNHKFGWLAEVAVDQATNQVAELLKVKKEELIYSSGATESVNLALRGIYELYAPSVGRHIISCKTEHRAVLDCLDYLEKCGAEISWIEPGPLGRIDPAAIKEAIRMDTVMVCLMWVNNETGLIHPIKEIGKICKEEGILFFCDATQAVGKIPVYPRENGISVLALSAHKLYGPKGIGALYISSENPRVKLSPQIVGGGQQRGLRSGTLNVPGIVGLGLAAEIAAGNMDEEYKTANNFTALLLKRLSEELGHIQLNSATEQSMPNILNISIKGISTPELLGKIANQLAVSAGSACSSSSGRPSHVLTAMGLTTKVTSSSIRISCGRFTTLEEINKAADILIDTSIKLRNENPTWLLGV